ncbi:hypothetical protein QWY28_22500 [Nocardioides sp. SOB77]|uniref:PDGLE domain-containing protein n=1 Tax=Nocardioides oceani TaxID=3058369 RepID=A0ABT8FMI6_9ACTN|nr:hypothetical protein [Nocardioides oceani]MDN4175749.1 hypothetical protein [Nocardioides oceani]
MRSRPGFTRSLLALAILLAAVAVWFAVANPSISGTLRGDAYSYSGCSAPYDTVLNDDDNVPGGEPRVNGADIAARCVAAGEDRFAITVAAGVASLLALLGSLVAAFLSRRREA